MTDSTKRSKFSTVQQVSSGGVAFRRSSSGVEVAIVAVGEPQRWQLPKGIVDAGESPEVTAVREVQEEAGIQTKLLQSIDTIEYWYVGDHRGQRVRFHKFVHFFLLMYQSGDVQDHDQEVHEARWVEIRGAIAMLAFKSEKQVLEKAQEMIQTLVE